MKNQYDDPLKHKELVRDYAYNPTMLGYQQEQKHPAEQIFADLQTLVRMDKAGQFEREALRVLEQYREDLIETKGKLDHANFDLGHHRNRSREMLNDIKALTTIVEKYSDNHRELVNHLEKIWKERGYKTTFPAPAANDKGLWDAAVAIVRKAENWFKDGEAKSDVREYF